MKKTKLKKSNKKRRASFGLLFLGKERELFVESLSLLLSAGMSVSGALSAIGAELKSKRLKKIINSVREDVESGSPVWKALRESELLPERIISLIKIGEETGRLTENLKVVTLQQEKERALRSKLVSAMLYPVLVLVLAVLIGTGIAIFILPRLAKIYGDLDIALPTLTKLLISSGNFLDKYPFAAPVFLITFVFVGYLLFLWKKARYATQNILFKVSAVKKLIQGIEISRFGFILGTLLNSGVSITVALNSLEEATSFVAYKRFYKYLKENIEDGNSLQKSFVNYPKVGKLFPISTQELIFTSEQSGHLPETLVKISEMYESKNDALAKNLTVLLEPLLLVIVWVGVAGIAMAVIMPIYGLVGGINQDMTEGEEAASGQSSPVLSTVTPTPIPTLLPTPTITPSPLPTLKKTLEISSNSLGYLNVRDKPSQSGKVLQRAKSGEIYEYTNTQSGWYEIVLNDGLKGWVSGQYIKVLNK